MRKLSLWFALAACSLAAQVAPAAPPADVQQLMLKELTDLPGKEGLMLTVTYPPGGSSEVHRHNAHVFVYVLAGSIVMQAKGGQAKTLQVGETFYESPDDIHAVSRNASGTQPAKFLVVLIKNQGAPATVPAR